MELFALDYAVNGNAYGNIRFVQQLSYMAQLTITDFLHQATTWPENLSPTFIWARAHTHATLCDRERDKRTRFNRFEAATTAKVTDARGDSN